MPRSAPANPAADRLSRVAEPVLRGAARGLAAERGGFRVGELWLFDGGPEVLTLAARWSGEADRAAVSTARRLADAPADVAALAGGAVALENAADFDGWDVHTQADAGLCLPVASETTVHGVLWLFADHPLEMSDGMVELAEVVAGRLALEVERAESGERKADASDERAETDRERASTPATLPRRSLPVVAPKLDGAPRSPLSAAVAPVSAAGWLRSSADALATAGCWDLADGRLLALAAAAIDSPESTLASQRAAVGWLAKEAPVLAKLADDAGDLLTWLNRGLIDSPHVGEGLAAAVSLVDPTEAETRQASSRGTYAVAGPTTALKISAAATGSSGGDLVPLGWAEPEAAYAPRPFELLVGERLVLVAGDPRLTSPLLERRLADTFRAATGDAHQEMTADGCLRRLARSGVNEALAAVAVRRG